VVAPKTGKYRATLPKNHPQTEELKSNPLSYARFVKDEEFTFEGLEDYDTSVITWEFLTK
jgi:hypothetical protein